MNVTQDQLANALKSIKKYKQPVQSSRPEIRVQGDLVLNHEMIRNYPSFWSQAN